jgi:hypothetical protein
MLEENMLKSRESPDSRAARRPLVGYVAAVFGAVLLVLPNLAVAQITQKFALSSVISLPSPQTVTSFDISFDDSSSQLYFLADRTNKFVDVIDTSTSSITHDKVIAQLVGTPPFAGASPMGNDFSGPNGVVPVANVDYELWVGDYDTVHGTGVVKVLDLTKGGITTHVITTGGVARADELCYDPVDKLILVANDAEPITPAGGAPFDTFISTTNYQIVKQITMNGLTPLAPLATNGIEQCQYSSKTGEFYQNIPENSGPGNDTQPGQVIELSPKSLSIVGAMTIPITDCAGPQGLALGPGNQALLGCNDPNKTVKSTVIINVKKGTVVKTLPNLDGADQVWFDPSIEDYFLGISGGATPGILGVIAKKKGLAPSPTTGLGAHSVAADQFTNEVYVPIPSTGGTTTCSSKGGVNANGCIAIFKDAPRRLMALAN